MSNKKLVSVMLGVFIAVMLAWVSYYFVLNGKGVVLEQWETSNGTFRIRVQRRPELFDFLPRYNYIFQSQSRGSTRWSNITTLRFDDPLAIPRDQVRFLNSDIGYLFMISTYAVTTDAGEHWFVFNVRTDPPLGKKDSYLTIRDLRVEVDGTGTMALYSKVSAEGEFELRTKDYGRHWAPK
jgi:hypothetical protein